MIDLDRFMVAQDEGGTFERALAELRAGRKRSHWMWFVFPQSAGLGHSSTSRRFALSSVDEPEAYLRHPVLGPRLIEVIAALLTSRAATEGATAEDILGAVDALKLRSSMTLFLEAAPDRPEFAQVLEHFFGGQPDPITLQILSGRQNPVGLANDDGP